MSESTNEKNSMDATELALKAPVTQATLQRHVFVCTGSSCSSHDSEDTLDRFKEVLSQRGLLYAKAGKKLGTPQGTIIVTKCGSIGLCSIGPAVLIYPDGVWYHHVQADDVEEVVESHLIGRQPVERLLALRIQPINSL
jgi:(2Fe-2S) ferredoxin